MTNPFKSPNYKWLVPYFFLAVALIIAYKIIDHIGDFFNAINWLWVAITPFFYAFVVAFIINIPYCGLLNLFGKIKLKFVQKIKKPVALVLAISFVIVIIYLFILLVVPHIILSISFFIVNLPIYYLGIYDLIENINEFDFFGFQIDIDGIYESVRRGLQNLSVEDVLSSLNAILAVPTALYTALIAIIAAIFMLVEKDRFAKFARRFVLVFTPTTVSDLIIKYAEQLNRSFKKYFYVQTIYGFICGVVSTIALMIMGSPFYAILGLLLGICNYVPYIGSIVATVVAILVVGFTQGTTMAIVAAIVIFVLQQLGANILYPILMGQSFKFSPLLVIISVTIGGAIAGVFGMIIAIPIATVLKDMLVSLTAYFEEKRIKARNRIDENIEEVIRIEETPEEN